ncbi:DUF3616 domain-containing protein [bacterium]|nr:DUF3616 domain-containing protein [bacterium]
MKTVLLVRHADIDTTPLPTDLTPLNAAGRERADALARVAGAADVTAVFTSAAARTKQTAAPLAAALGLQPAVLPTTFPQAAAAILDAPGPAALVVGHSTTVPQLVAALGGPADIPPPTFDDLFVLTAIAPTQAAVVRLKYGAASAPAPPPPSAGPRFVDHAGVTRPGTPVVLTGELFGGKMNPLTAVSGAEVLGGHLLLVSDEAKEPTVVQVLTAAGGGYAAAGGVALPAGDDEVDVEGIAADRAAGVVYVTGSHCRTRKIEGGVIGEVKQKKSREQFFRFKLAPGGTAAAVEGPKSLMPAVEKFPVLAAAATAASKENGLDVEGLAVKDGHLHFGFRGPVLRYGFVPVLSCRWDDPAGTARVRYVRLGGRGVRDLVGVGGGFLVLAGPVGDGDGTYRVYFWDGADQLPAGEDGPGPELLGEFAGLGAGKPEGLVVLNEAGRSFEVLLVCDGVPSGAPTRWALSRPGPA